MKEASKNMHARRPWVAIVAVMVIGLSFATAQLSQAGNRIGDGRHWGQGSLSREYVTIVDNTGSAWPVYAAAIEWDTAPKIDVVYKYGSCSGSPGHCIGVQVIPGADYPYGTCSQSGGFANVTVQSNGHINPDTTYIRFNGNCNSGSYTNRDRRALACEEEGHVLGLEHAWVGSGGGYNLNDVTCMASGHISNLHEKPRQHDFNEVDSIYTHSH